MKGRIIGILFGLLCIGMIFLEGKNFLEYYNNIFNPPEETKVASINEEISNEGGVIFTVKSVRDAKTIGANNYASFSTENNFIIVTVEIENGSNETYDLNVIDFKLVEGENEYEYYTNAIMALENPLYLDNINPGIKKEYVVVYETPFTCNEKSLRLKISGNIFSNKYIYIELDQDDIIEESTQTQETSEDINSTIDTEILDEETVEESLPKTGEIVSNTKDVEFCVLSVEDLSKIGENSYTSYTTENNFIKLSIKIENKGNEAYDVNALNFTLMEGEKEYQYYPNSILILEDILYIDTINPGLSKTYSVVYETPSLHSEGEYKLKITSFTYGEKYIYIDIR